MLKKLAVLTSLILIGGITIGFIHNSIMDTSTLKQSQQTYINPLLWMKGIASKKTNYALNVGVKGKQIQRKQPYMKTQSTPKFDTKPIEAYIQQVHDRKQKEIVTNHQIIKQNIEKQSQQKQVIPELDDNDDDDEDDNPIYHKIFTWAQYSKGKKGVNLMTCPSNNKCLITSDRSLIDGPSKKSIVVFEFFNAYFNVSDIPLPRKPHHRWALIHNESPDKSRIFSFQEAMEAFNYTATFKRESDYPITLQSVHDPMEWINPRISFNTKDKDKFQEQDGLAPIFYVQSHLHGVSSDRESFIEELMKYINVDSYGRSLHNKDIPEEFKGASKKYGHYKDLRPLEARYKFEIGFENALCKDYNTEKLFRPLTVGVVPIYKGSSTARDFLPSNKSAIFIDDFESPKHLADYLHYLNKNEIAYEEYLHHHETGFTNPILQELLEDEQFYKKPSVNLPENYDIFYTWLRSIRCYFCDRMHEEFIASQSDEVDEIRSIADITHVGCQLPIEAIKGKTNTLQHQEALRDYKKGLELALRLQQRLLDNE